MIEIKITLGRNLRGEVHYVRWGCDDASLDPLNYKVTLDHCTTTLSEGIMSLIKESARDNIKRILGDKYDESQIQFTVENEKAKRSDSQLIEIEIIRKSADGVRTVGFSFSLDGLEYGRYWSSSPTLEEEDLVLPSEEAVYNNALHTIAELKGSEVGLADVLFVPCERNK